jgi:hypothetical protein
MSYLKDRNGCVVVMYCILRSAGHSNAPNYNIRCTQATNIYSTAVHPDDTIISDFQVTHKDKGRSLKMAYKCRNM